jgi:primosomal protein N'
LSSHTGASATGHRHDRQAERIEDAGQKSPLWIVAGKDKSVGLQVDAAIGGSPAPLSMLRGHHHQRLLVHANRALDVQDVIREWLGPLEWPRGVRVAVDVDPYSFL